VNYQQPGGARIAWRSLAAGLAAAAGAIALAACGGGSAGAGMAGGGMAGGGMAGGGTARQTTTPRMEVRAAVLPAGTSAPASGTETSPALARRYAQRAVGGCLARAWRQAGFASSFASYAGHGRVQFATGSPSSPTGNFAQATLITVRVYHDGSVAGLPDSAQGAEGRQAVDNRMLAHWGCAG
jgi:hypothetical protein